MNVKLYSMYYDEAIDRMKHDYSFIDNIINTICSTNYNNLCLQFKPISFNTYKKTLFEFVLIDIPLTNKIPDSEFFNYYMIHHLPIITFTNVSNDAILIAPHKDIIGKDDCLNILTFMKSNIISQIVKRKFIISIAINIELALENTKFSNKYIYPLTNNIIPWFHFRVQIDSEKYLIYKKYSFK